MGLGGVIAQAFGARSAALPRLALQGLVLGFGCGALLATLSHAAVKERLGDVKRDDHNSYIYII